MTKQSSDLVAASLETGLIWRQIVETVRLTGGSDEDITSLKGDQERLRLVAKAILRQTDPLTVPAKSFLNANGLIRLTVTSEGVTGNEWIKRLGLWKRDSYSSGGPRKMLRSSQFVPTACEHKVVIIHPDAFHPDLRTYSEVLATAKDLGLRQPNMELACLLATCLAESDWKSIDLLGAYVCHKPFEISKQRLPEMLSLFLNTVSSGPISEDTLFHGSSGFAFLEP